MTELDAIARKWGDSLAIILPKEIVKKEKIKRNEKVHLILSRKIDVSKIWGTLKLKKTAQQLKDEERESGGDCMYFF